MTSGIFRKQQPSDNFKGRVYPQINKNVKYSAFDIIVHPNSL